MALSQPHGPQDTGEERPEPEPELEQRRIHLIGLEGQACEKASRGRAQMSAAAVRRKTRNERIELLL